MTATYRPLIGIPAATYIDQEYVATPTYRFNGNYPAALAACGALPVVIPLKLPEDVLRPLFEHLDGLCLAGGVDVDPAHYDEAPHPALGQVDAARDATELTLARWALAAGLPVLGICRGMQLLNVAAGGSLYQDLATQLPETIRHNYELADSPWERYTHRVRVEDGSRLAATLGVNGLMTNSFHHQAVKRVADGFAASAWAEDGVVEGIERAGPGFALGLQWHPEGVFRGDIYAQRIFEAFVSVARDGK